MNRLMSKKEQREHNDRWEKRVRQIHNPITMNTATAGAFNRAPSLDGRSAAFRLTSYDPDDVTSCYEAEIYGLNDFYE